MSVLLTEQQEFLVDQLIELVKNCNVFYYKTVGGFAGTGKTTMICEFRKQLETIKPLTVSFVTFTGKASSVLRNKLEAQNAIYSKDYCGTIHGLIYDAEVKWDNKLKTFVICGWKRKSKYDLNSDLIIIDEASMVSEDVWIDLKSYEIPIIAFGDHAQLPPISDNGKGFHLMLNPDFALTEIHRQAMNSPIINLSKFVRENGYIPDGFYSDQVFKLNWTDSRCQQVWNKLDYSNQNLQILCGFNTTRANLNKIIRDKLGYFQQAPYPDEKLVYLNNNHNIHIMNGQIGKVIWLMALDDAFKITLEIDGGIYESFISNKCFGEVSYTMYDKSKKLKCTKEEASKYGFMQVDFCDYGYVMSVHKSQGSEWDKIVLFEI